MSGRTRTRRWALSLLLVALTCAVFGRSVGHGFVLIDDDTNIYANPLVNPALSPTGEDRLARTWTEPYLQLYIPVTYTAWALVADGARLEPGADEPDPQAAGGLSPRPFHLLNVAMQALAALLVFWILRTLLGVDIAAAAGALLFAVHPLQAEAVAWASGFKDLAGGTLALASLGLYLSHARSSGSGRVAWFGSLALFALGFLAKPSAVVVPLLAGVLDLLVLRRGWRQAAAGLWPFFALAAAGVLVATGAQPADPELPIIALASRPLVAFDALGFYVGKLAAPVELIPFYGRRPDGVLEGGRWWIGASIVGALALGALACRKRSGVPLAALGVFVAALAPVLGCVPFTFQVFSTVADRYAYLALLGPALLVGWWVRGSKPGLVLAFVIAALLGARTIDQVGYWADSKGLFLHNLAINDESSFVHSNLGEVYAREGDQEAAIEHFEAAVRLKPSSAQLRNNLGSFLGPLGRLDEAFEHLSEAVRLDPEYARARMGLASTLVGLTRYPEAIEELRAVHQFEPEFAPAYMMRATLHGALGDSDAAAEAYAAAIEVDPDQIDARVQLAGLHMQGGRMPQATAVLREGVERSPEHAQARAELGRALMITNRAVDALPHLEEALRLDPALEYVQPMLDAARAAVGGGQ